MQKLNLFSFGEPVPFLDKSEIMEYLESTMMFEKYYSPPIDFNGLAKAFYSTSYHSTAINVKKNILLSTVETSGLISRLDLERICVGFFNFRQCLSVC